jgi:hypothetical protein
LKTQILVNDSGWAARHYLLGVSLLSQVVFEGDSFLVAKTLSLQIHDLRC